MSDQDEIERLESRLRELRGREAERDNAAAASPSGKSPKPSGLAENNKLAATVIVGAILLFIVVMLVVGSFSSPTATPGATSAEAGRPASPASSAPLAEPPAPVSPWVYARSTDPMDDSTTQRACVRSTNVAILSPPYQPIHAQMCVRRTSKWGLDVFISMEGDAQVLCNSYNGCRIPTRFDDAAATNYRGSGADDYSSNIAFIADGSAAGFVEKLKTAESTKVALTFYRDGVQVMEFDTTGLQWPVPEDAAGVP